MNTILQYIIILVGISLIVSLFVFAKKLFNLKDEHLMYQVKLNYARKKRVQVICLACYYLYVGIMQYSEIQSFNKQMVILFIIPFLFISITEKLIRKKLS